MWSCRWKPCCCCLWYFLPTFFSVSLFIAAHIEQEVTFIYLSIKLSHFITIFHPSRECIALFLLGGAAALNRISRICWRGKRAGALIKLCQQGFWSALPSIHLWNIRSLANKMDKLLLLNITNMDFSSSTALSPCASPKPGWAKTFPKANCMC